MPRYFHVSKAELPDGTELRPSKYKETAHFRVARNAFESGIHAVESLLLADWLTNVKANEERWIIPIWIKEAVFEWVRKADFPDATGRGHASFLWESLDDARGNLEKNSGEGGGIYECSAEAEAEQTRNRVDIRHWERVQLDVARPLARQLDDLRESARAYYSQTASENPLWEILIVPPVRVTGAVS